MMMFALCLNPLIHSLKKHLKGICVHRKKRKPAVIVCVDDFSLFVTLPEEIPANRESIILRNVIPVVRVSQ
jgi:hypothetical protein